MAVDGIFHVMRTFEDPDITHVEDRIGTLLAAHLQSVHPHRHALHICSSNASSGGPLHPLEGTVVFKPRRAHSAPTDPVADLEIIHGELRAKDLERCSNQLEALVKMIPRGLKKEQKEEMAALEKIKAFLESGKDIRYGSQSSS